MAAQVDSVGPSKMEEPLKLVETPVETVAEVRYLRVLISECRHHLLV